MSRRSSGHHQRFFYNFRISSRKSKSRQKLEKKSHILQYSFAKKTTLKLNSLDIENNMLPKHSLKPFWLYKFSSKNVSVWCQKNICTTPFLNAQELHFWGTLKANVCIFLYISLKKICFRDVVRFYLVGGGMGGDWINHLRRFAVWALEDILQYFTIFENSTIFIISILLFIALKRWNFQDKLDFKGKIGATFHTRSHSLSI